MLEEREEGKGKGEVERKFREGGRRPPCTGTADNLMLLELATCSFDRMAGSSFLGCRSSTAWRYVISRTASGDGNVFRAANLRRI